MTLRYAVAACQTDLAYPLDRHHMSANPNENTWIPYDVHSSPHDLAGYDEPLFPVADTPIELIETAKQQLAGGAARKPPAGKRPQR